MTEKPSAGNHSGTRYMPSSVDIDTLPKNIQYIPHDAMTLYHDVRDTT